MKRYFLLLNALVCLTVMANQPYITTVYDFEPAPGQFTNMLPEYEDGDTKADIIAKAQTLMTGSVSKWGKVTVAKGMVSLGAYGGYMIFGFDHPVVNVPGEYDFHVYGNAFGSNDYSGGGSSEPGIIMVSRDDNGNGLPDDAWYEIAGSYHNHPKTIKNYEITYYRPEIGDNWLKSAANVNWTSNDPDSLRSGHIDALVEYHRQTYWPMWHKGDATLTFKGTKLPNNAVDLSTPEQTYFLLYFLGWGYADDIPNDNDPGVKIEWAVNADGESVALDHIDFVKVYSALNQQCGWLGETSTEVCGALDLHPDEPLPLMGDVNSDLIVDVADVVAIANDVMGETPEVYLRHVADVNHDGLLNVADVVALANQVMGN